MEEEAEAPKLCCGSGSIRYESVAGGEAFAAFGVMAVLWFCRRRVSSFGCRGRPASVCIPLILGTVVLVFSLLGAAGGGCCRRVFLFYALRAGTGEGHMSGVHT